MFNLHTTLTTHGAVCQNRAGDLYVITLVNLADDQPITAVTLICPPGGEPFPLFQKFNLDGSAFNDSMKDAEDLINLQQASNSMAFDSTIDFCGSTIKVTYQPDFEITSLTCNGQEIGLCDGLFSIVSDHIRAKHHDSNH